MGDPRATLNRLLQTESREVGCTDAFELFDRFAERRLAYADAERCHPGVAAHLAACDACAKDFEGLLRAVRDSTK